MRRRVLGVILSLIAITPAWAQQRAPDGVAIDDDGHPQYSTFSTCAIDRRGHGDLEATGTGEMLTGATGTKDSAGYVAVEHVNGTLNGRTGTFLLQHDGMMARSAQHLTVTVVPDSGTGELAGLAGTIRS